MAFDMIIADANLRDHIDHHEEEFFMLIEQHDLDCPVLREVWESFYRGPRIYPGRTGAIVSELDLVDGFIRKNRPPEINLSEWSQTYPRLRIFFAKAQELEMVVECVSD